MFTVVLCTYDRADIVGEAIERVLAQNWRDFELIAVDDGSSDDTLAVLNAIDDERLRVVHRPNGGLSAARNTGIGEAGGRFVVFLDDDDHVSPDWLSGLERGVDDSTGFTSCTCRLVTPDGTLIREKAAVPHALFPDIRGVFTAGTFAIDRTVVSDLGGYAEDLRVNHQTELLLRVLPELKRRGMTTALVDEPLITIERREQEDRPRRQPADLLQGAEFLIDRHGRALATNPTALANYHAIAGVSAMKVGEIRRGRRHLRRAARVQPAKPKHWLRLGVSLISPLARRAWR